jgi:hypothetical protein
LNEARIQCATIEAQVRDEVTRAAEERERKIREMYELRLRNEMARHERKTDAKIDMLFKSPVKNCSGLLNGADAIDDSIEYDNSMVSVLSSSDTRRLIESGIDPRGVGFR